MNNIAYIDGQNLHLGTSKEGWNIDYSRFRIYLKEKYNVTEAYYFLGFVKGEEEKLYNNLQKAGFILVFRDHSPFLLGKKKGNVDCDIIFSIMKRVIEKKKDKFDKIILVSGDGDYIKLVKYLITEKMFLKILFPNKKKSSSLYKKLGSEYYDCLDAEDIKEVISYRGK